LMIIVPIILREFAGLVAQELPRTPQPVVLAMLMVVPLAMVRLGLEPLARVAAVLIPLAGAILVVIFLPTVDLLRPTRLLPATALGWGPLLQASAPTAAFYAETALLGFVLPLRSCGRRRAWGAAAAGLAAVGLVLAVSTAWSLLIFGPLTAKLTSTLFQVTRVAEVSEFITHMDALLIAVWMAGGLVKIAIWFFCACRGGAQSTGLGEYRSLTLPLAAFTVIAANAWFESSAGLTLWIGQIWPFWGLATEIGLPLAVWIATVLTQRRRRRRQGGAAP
jgi:spore germination protein KB